MATVQASALIAGQGGQTNWVRNPRGDGAVTGSTGNLPTFWSVFLLPGLNQQVVASGIDAASGLPYVDVEIYGAAGSAGNNYLYIEPSTYSIAAPGDTFAATAWVGITAGTLTNVSSILYGVQITTGGITFDVTNTGARFTRYVGSATVGAADFPIGPCFIELSVNPGPVDITLRLGGFQLERGLVSTLPILPPVGAPGLTTRALQAVPASTWLGQTRIAGAGGIAATLSRVGLSGARIAGQGSVTGAVPGTLYAAVRINGQANTTARSLIARPARALIQGSTSLAADAHNHLLAPVTQLGGVGRVQAAPFALRPGAARIAGLGARSANAQSLRAALAIIHGVGGTRGNNTPITESAAAHIAGLGGFSARAYHPLAVVGGAGKVQASARTEAKTQARIAGSGSLNENPARILQARARIAGSAYVEVDLDHVRPAVSLIRGAGRVSANATQVHQAFHVGAIIHGAASFKASTTVRFAFQASAWIRGGASLHAVAGKAVHGVAQIHGAGAVKSSAYATVLWRANAHINGTASLRASAADAAVWHAASTIRGIGGVRAQLRAYRPAASVIHGLGAIKSSAHVPTAWAATSRIAGSGGVLAPARAIRHAQARIAGTAATRATSRVLRFVHALIGGQGHVTALGIKAPWHVGARIAGNAHVTAKVSVPGGARINGRGAVRVTPAVAHPAKTLIASVGRFRVRPIIIAHARSSVHGLAHLETDADLKSHVHAQAHIAGQGGLQPDPFIPRNRVALYGVHLPPTKRGVFV